MQHPDTVIRAIRPEVRVHSVAFAGWLGAAVLFAGGICASAQAETPTATANIQYDIPAGDLGAALNRFAQQAGVAIAVDAAQVQGLATPGLRGSYGVEEGFNILLRGSGYAIDKSAAGYVLVAAPADSGQALTTLPEVTVTAAGESAVGPGRGYVASRGTTATKTDTRLIETPQSISVITKDQLESQEADTLGEALRYSAGIKGETFGFDDRGFDTFVDIRGFPSPVFRDGLRINAPGFSGLNTDPYLAERIEVLRGPASVLYGQGSLGGIVNQVTKRPLDKPFRELILEAGSFDRFETKFDVSDALSEDGTLDYRLTGRVATGESQVDFIEQDRAVIAPTLTWRPNADTTLTFLSSYSKDDLGGSSNSFLPAVGTVFTNPNGRIPVNRFTGEENFDALEREQYYLGYLLEHRFNERWSFRQNVRYDEADLNLKALFGGGLDASDPAQRSLTRFSFSALTDTKVLSIDNHAQATFSTGAAAHTLLIGLDYQSLDFDEQLGFDSAPSLDLYNPVYGAIIPDPALFQDSVTEQRQAGLYLQDQIKFHDKYIVQLGGRYDWVSNDTENFGARTDDQSDREFTGRAGFVYLADNGLAPYVSYAESFLPVVGTSSGGDAFKPETGQQYEIGVKYEPPGANAFITLAAYDLTRQNALSADSSFTQFQIGEQRSRGIELEAVASLDSGLDLKAAYTYLDLEITDSAIPEEVGNTPDGQARHRASLRADYTVKSGQLAGLGFGAGVRYTGETFGDVGNSFEVDDFTLVDATVHYDWQRFRFALSAQNLFDKEYVERCFDTTGCFYGAAQEITASVRYRLD